MRFFKKVLWCIAGLLIVVSCHPTDDSEKILNADAMLIRIAEIQIYPDYQQEYLSILKQEAAASVKKEPGVIAIFPMVKDGNPTEIRILEVYKDQAAYESHLQTPHFKHYKTTTSEMVKSLNLIEMKSIDQQSMPKIFEKL